MSAERLSEIIKSLSGTHNVEPLSGTNRAQWECDNYNANEGHLHEQDGYNCDICKNKGVIYKVEKQPYSGWDMMTSIDCKCMAIRETLRRARRSGLGNILTDYTFDKYETPEDWQQKLKLAAQEFCKYKAAQCFYVGGQTGAGKTHICTAIAAQYIKAGFNCRYMLWVDDTVKLNAVVNDSAQYQKQMDDFKNVDILYIDDFFKVQEGTKPTAAEIRRAYELLNYRLLDKDKITIISSEFTINEVLEIDEATGGRVYKRTGAGGKYAITIDRDINKNYRLK